MLLAILLVMIGLFVLGVAIFIGLSLFMQHQTHKYFKNMWYDFIDRDENIETALTETTSAINTILVGQEKLIDVLILLNRGSSSEQISISSPNYNSNQISSDVVTIPIIREDEK